MLKCKELRTYSREPCARLEGTGVSSTPNTRSNEPKESCIKHSPVRVCYGMLKF
jgi:hypothetical protein